jgi:hypothetical protein
VHDFLLQGSKKFWSGKLSTPNILEWTASHSKKIGVHTFPLQIGVHEVKSWSAFSLTLTKYNICPTRSPTAEKKEEKKTKRKRNDEANLRKPERGW